MSKTVQIGNAQETYEILKARAAEAGLSVPEYLHREWEKSRPKLTKEELIERIERRRPLLAGFDVVQAIQEARDERDAQMDEWLKDVRR